MTVSDHPDVTRLGVLDGVEFSIGRTSMPWTVGIDTIVVSVGSTLGKLGHTLRQQFPDGAWRGIPFDQIGPDRPVMLRLNPSTGEPQTKLHHAVLVSAHTNQIENEITADSVARATAAAIRLADVDRSKSLGLPMLGAGASGEPLARIVSSLVPTAIETARALDSGSLRELVFLSQNDLTSDLITTEFLRQYRATPSGGATEEFGNLTASENNSGYSSTELAGGVSSDLVDPNIGIPLSKDSLGVAPYVSMLATVIADRSTPLPLSIGIFGQWGSGKSYFMAMLRDRIAHLSKLDDTRYCDEIVHIGFNAWHYSDSNLWASMADEIFRQLAGSDPTSRQRAEKIRTELTHRSEQRRRLETVTQDAATTVAALQSEIDRARSAGKATALDLVAALSKTAEFRAGINGLWSRLGIKDPTEQAGLLADQLRDPLSDAVALARLPRERNGRIALVGAAVFLLIALVGYLVAPAIGKYLAWIGGAIGASTALGGILALSAAKSGLHKFRILTENLQQRLQQAGDDRVSRELEHTLQRLRTADAELRVAQAQLDDVVTHIGELGHQLMQLAPGNRLHAFVNERANSDSYTRNLGLISTVRKDFEQLVELMVEWRTDPDKSTHDFPPVDRIVLYIDDLDRCSPKQVVEVLQAVHLLLAFELFVVVVGVDPRWLLRSLRSNYSDLLIDPDLADPAEYWHTPEDYLEKILNIPLTLQNMPPGSLQQMFSALTDTETPDNEPPPPPLVTPVSEQPPLPREEQYATIGVEPGSEVAGQHDPNPVVIRHPMTGVELKLLSALEQLIDSPREAKRLFNLYRMVRATRDLSAGSRFLGLDGNPGEYQAVVLLLGLLTAHSRLLSSVLDTPPVTDSYRGGLAHRPAQTPWNEFVADLEPHRSGDSWTNQVIGPIPDNHVAQWIRLHRGLEHASTLATLPDLVDLQTWLPRMRRFSYTVPTSTWRAAVDSDGEHDQLSRFSILDRIP